MGIPLPRLRLWAMLRSAMTELPAESAAAAAAFAGFADQAHLTRTARTLAGRIPSEILRPGASGAPALTHQPWHSWPWRVPPRSRSAPLPSARIPCLIRQNRSGTTRARPAFQRTVRTPGQPPSPGTGQPALFILHR
ncbi:hypothetical protein [Streptomyces malaysiensis]|uniref:hypothetical protein n=1 Tax=Streptomyces malaysiensis TaxID=92644 RepID=UPI003F4CB3F4